MHKCVKPVNCLTDLKKTKLPEMHTWSQLLKHVKLSVRNIGATLDPSLSFGFHISKVIQSCFRHLKSVVIVDLVLSFKDNKSIIRVFITSCLDHFNDLVLMEEKEAKI